MGGRKVPESLRLVSSFTTLSCILVSMILAFTLSPFCTTHLWWTREWLLPEVLLEEWLSWATLISEWLWRRSPDFWVVPARIQGWRMASSGVMRFLGFQLEQVKVLILVLSTEGIRRFCYPMSKSLDNF